MISQVNYNTALAATTTTNNAASTKTQQIQDCKPGETNYFTDNSEANAIDELSQNGEDIDTNDIDADVAKSEEEDEAEDDKAPSPSVASLVSICTALTSIMISMTTMARSNRYRH